MIPNKHLQRGEKRGKSGGKRNCHRSKFHLKQAVQRSVYKVFSICIQIVFVLYINRFWYIYIDPKWFVYKSQAQKSLFRCWYKRSTRRVLRRTPTGAVCIICVIGLCQDAILLHVIRCSCTIPLCNLGPDRGLSLCWGVRIGAYSGLMSGDGA